MNLEFSSLKAAWHLERIQLLRIGVDVAPTHLQLIISDLCNQDCSFCAYRMSGGFSTELFAGPNGEKNPNRKMPTEKAFEILEDAWRLGTRAVQFTGGGEPTVHPDWVKIIQKALDLGFKVGLVTNGIRLHEKHKAVLERLTWLRISLDAGKAETYTAIRNSDTFDKALAAIRFAVKLNTPLVGVGFVVTRENYQELVQATQLVKQLGAPYIRLSAMFSFKGAEYYDGFWSDLQWYLKLARKLSDENFQVIDFVGDRIADLQQQAPDYQRCGFQQFVLYIGADQKVYTCCTNAYTLKGTIGDLSQQTFAQWLTVSQGRFKSFDARQCHHCQFNEKNRIIDFLTSKEPPHVDFV